MCILEHGSERESHHPPRVVVWEIEKEADVVAASLTSAKFGARLVTVIVRGKRANVLRVNRSDIVLFALLAPRPPGAMSFHRGARR